MLMKWNFHFGLSTKLQFDNIYISDLHMQIAENAGLLKVDSHLQEHYKGLRNSFLTGNVFFFSFIIDSPRFPCCLKVFRLLVVSRKLPSVYLSPCHCVMLQTGGHYRQGSLPQISLLLFLCILFFNIKIYIIIPSNLFAVLRLTIFIFIKKYSIKDKLYEKEK